MIIKSTDKKYKANKTELTEVDREPYIVSRLELRRAIVEKDIRVWYQIVRPHGFRTPLIDAEFSLTRKGRVLIEIIIGCQTFDDKEARKLRKWAMGR
jgi:hypothetical protein